VSRRIGMALAALLAGGTLACSEPAGPPNLLLIAVDTLRADHLGAYGYARPTSPSLDRFMNGAVVFEDAQATSSWTLTSFASLFTGLLPSAHGCTTYGSALDASFRTLAEILGEAGFDTAAVVSHVFLGPKHGLPQGFAHFESTVARYDAAESNQAVSSPVVTDRALDWLATRRRDDAPFFLFVHYFDPHAPYRKHAGITERFGNDERSRYDGEIAFTDAHVGRLLDGLANVPGSEHTVVVFTSDHGEEFGEHGGARHGSSLYQEVMRVPLAIAAPGIPPRRVPDPVSGVDVLPTLLDLLGLPAPREPIAGRSLVPALLGDPLSGAPVLGELRLKPLFPADALLLGRWKLVEGVTTPRLGRNIDPTPEIETQLFDRVADPGERRDLGAEHPEEVARLRETLHAEIESARALGRRYRQAAPVEHTDAEREHLRALGYVE